MSQCHDEICTWMKECRVFKYEGLSYSVVSKAREEGCWCCGAGSCRDQINFPAEGVIGPSSFIVSRGALVPPFSFTHLSIHSSLLVAIPPQGESDLLLRQLP
jgi:hypothetical protein